MSFTAGIRHGDSSCLNSCPCKNISFGLSIWSAAQYNDLNTIVNKLKKDRSSVNKVDAYGYTPLHFAAQHNNLHIVQYLLSNGAYCDGTKTGSCGATPLHRSAYFGHGTVCKVLLDAGADVNAADTSFRDLRTPLHKAASRGHLHVFALLLRRGANREALDSSGFTPIELLEQACMHNEDEETKR